MTYGMFKTPDGSWRMIRWGGPIFLLLLFWSIGSKAQGTWTDGVEVYNGKGVRVLIQFNYRDNSCLQGGKTNKFRFQVQGYPETAKHSIFISFDYLNCQGVPVNHEVRLDLSEVHDTNPIQKIDYSYTGERIQRLYPAAEQPQNRTPYVPPTATAPPVVQDPNEPGTRTKMSGQPAQAKNQQPTPQTPAVGKTTSAAPSSVPPVAPKKPKTKRPVQSASFKFGIGGGLDFGTRPMGSAANDSSVWLPVNPFFLGGQVSLPWDFILHDFVVLGIEARGSWGSWESLLDQLENQAVQQQDYSYKRYDLAARLAFGTRGLKLLAKYEHGISFHEHERREYNSGTLRTSYRSEYAIRREAMSCGFQLLPYYAKQGQKRTTQWEILAVLAREYPWQDNRFDEGFDPVWQWGGRTELRINNPRTHNFTLLHVLATQDASFGPGSGKADFFKNLFFSGGIKYYIVL